MNIEAGKNATDLEMRQCIREELALDARRSDNSKEETRQTAEKRPRPFKQGSLDALCGLYAIANAMNLAHTYCLSDEGLAMDLLSKMAAAAVRMRGSARFLRDGLDGIELAGIFRSAQKVMSAKGYRFVGRRPSGSALIIHSNSPKKRIWFEQAAKATNSAVILYVEKSSYAHWSVLKDAREGRVSFFDSDTMRSARIDEVEPWMVLQTYDPGGDRQTSKASQTG